MSNFWWLVLWLIYFIWPYDLIPDTIPMIGRVDDLLLLFLLWYYVLRKKPGAAHSPGGSGGYSEGGGAGGRGESAAGSRRVREGGRVRKDPYRILGVERGAGAEEIRHAYRLLASQYHPDKVAHLGQDLQDLAKIKFQEIGWAYEQIMGKKTGTAPGKDHDAMTENEIQFVAVHTLSDRFEADLLIDTLEKEGVPALLRSFGETAYSALFIPQKGWGKIMVPKEMAAQARGIIRALMQDLTVPSRLYSSKSEIDPLLWERLRQADPEEICRSAAVGRDAETGAYRVPFFETELRCQPEEERIEPAAPALHHAMDFQLYLAVLHYLLEAQDKPLSNKWVSEKDLPSGEIFFRGPHGLPLGALIEAFDPRPDLLDAGAGVLGAQKIDMGDAAYQFRPLPRVPLLLVFWKGDDEFKADIHMLFDETITLHLRNLDIVFALANVFSRTLLSAAGQMRESGGK